MELEEIKSIPIHDVAKWLGITNNGSSKVKCYNHSAHKNGDQHPSMSLNKGTNRFKCFACHEGGSSIDMVMGAQGVDFNDAVRMLQEEFNININIAEKGNRIPPVKQKENRKLTIRQIQDKAYVDDQYYNFERMHKYGAGNPEYVKTIYKDSSGDKTARYYHLIDKDKDLWADGKGGPSVLYNQRALNGDVGIPVLYSPSEKDVDTLTGYGFLSITAGGDNDFKSEMASLFKGRDVIFFGHNDSASAIGLQKIAVSLKREVNSLKTAPLSHKWEELFGEPMPDKADITDLVEKYGLLRGVEGIKDLIVELVESAKEVKIQDKNPAKVTEVTQVTPVPREEKNIDSEIFPEIPFPIEVFPDELKKLSFTLSEVLQVPAELPACCMLPIIGSAVGNALKVSPRFDWVSSPFIWFMLIAATGFGKTHLIDMLMKPLDKLQSEAYKEYEDLVELYDAALRKAKKNPETDVPVKPYMKHYKVSDFTVETLVDIFCRDPNGILISRDELSGFFFGFNQYKAGRGNDRQQILELFNGNSMQVDRKGNTIFAEKTGASIIGGIQPAVFKDIFKDDSYDDGLASRFLMLPVETTKKRFSRKTVSAEDMKYWKHLLEWCYELRTHKETTIAPFSDAAVDVFEEFYNEFQEIIPFVSQRIKAFIPKLITYCLRFTGVLHILKAYPSTCALNETVSKDTVASAIKLTKYFAGQSVKCMKLYGEQKGQLNEYQVRLIDILQRLQTKVSNGKLLLKDIRDEFNQSLPEPAQITPNKIQSILSNDFKLITEKSTGNLSYLVWEREKIEKLFSKTGVTCVPSVTIPEEEGNNNHKTVTEVTEVTPIPDKKKTKHLDLEGTDINTDLEGNNKTDLDINLNEDEWELI